MRELRPRVLVLSSERDFASDYVVSELRTRAIPYARLNLEDLCADSVTLDPASPCLWIAREDVTIIVEPDVLTAVYFRGPTFTRHYTPADIEPSALARRQQGWAFLRNLQVFDRAKWVNNPSAVYAAEHKARQIQQATRVGLAVPHTVIGNTNSDIIRHLTSPLIAIKSLDALIFATNQRSGFVYTQLEPRSRVIDMSLHTFPVIAQQGVDPKVDIRVTVADTEVFAASIEVPGRTISGDWRKIQGNAIVTPYSLPEDIREKCVALVARLGLSFGAIDLVLNAGTFYFLEVNPSGEWAWLEPAFGAKISSAIVNTLCHA